MLGMEYTAPPAAPRGIFRRLFPWTLSLGLFAGGGYGVYAYALPKKPDAANQTAAAAKASAADNASSASAAKQQIKQLFGGTPTSTSSTDNRYVQTSAPAQAPPLPSVQEPRDEVATPRSADAVAPQNPFAAAPSNPYADRYAVATQSQAKPAEVSNPGGEQPTAITKPTEPQITRGQEPGAENPLRSASPKPAASTPATSPAADEARTAFSEQPPMAQPAQNNVIAIPQRAADAIAENIKQPAPAAAPSGAGGRYGEAPATNAWPAAGNPPAVASAEPQAAEQPAGKFKAAAPAEGIAAQPLKSAGSQQPPSFAAEVQQAQPLVNANADPGLTPTPGITTTDGAGRPGERILEGLQNPAVAIQKLVPPEIQVGKKCTFAIKVQNNSQRPAQNVQIRDDIPLGTQLIGTAPKANVTGSQVTWDLGTLSPGEERVVEMELMPTAEGELGSVATVTFTGQASAKVKCTKPELALRLSAGPRVMIGQQQLVQIEVSNPGTGDATGVMLLETVPQGVSHEAGPALEFEVGTLHPGQSRRLDLVLNAEQAGRINNVMVAKADASLEVQAGCEFEVIAPALKVSVNGPKQKFLELPAKFQMSVTNPGTAAAKDVQLVTQLPKGLQFVSADNYGEYDPATHSVRWSLAELPANEHGTVELTALPVEAGEQTLQVASRAQQGLEDRTEAKVTVEGLVALSFEIKAAVGAVAVGEETAYDITVVNQGSKAATNVQVTAVIPRGLKATNGQGASRFVAEDGRATFAPLPQLAPKAEAKFRIQVQGLQAGDLRTKVMVTADEVQDPITKEQGTLVYADQ
jgi:uncharacterized repeat protein (TIGR01451 family)